MYLFLGLLLFCYGTQGIETDEACEIAKEKFDSCNDQARAKFSGFGCSSACDFVTSLASCLADLTSTCPALEGTLLKKTKKLLVRMEAANPNWDKAACPGAVALKLKYPSLDCSQADRDFTQCHAEAYRTYQTELAAGGDGRIDFVERKTCNWITDTFQTCHDAMVETRCKTHYELNSMVDVGLHGILTNLAATQPAWDSSKCPTASAHLVRWEEGREAREASAREVTASRATTTTWSQSMCQMLC